MTAEQIARVVEQAARAGGLDDLLQDGGRQVRLADARLPVEQQALADDRKGLGDPSGLRRPPLERFVVRREIAERAVLIPLGNVRVGETLVADLIAPAVAAHDAPARVPFSSTGFQPVSSQQRARRSRHE